MQCLYASQRRSAREIECTVRGLHPAHRTYTGVRPSSYSEQHPQHKPQNEMDDTCTQQQFQNNAPPARSPPSLLKMQIADKASIQRVSSGMTAAERLLNRPLLCAAAVTMGLA